MRSPDVALTSTEKGYAAGQQTVVSYLDVVTPVIVATALINQSAFVYPLSTLTVDTTSGWTGVEAGMDVFVGTTAGACDIGIYRVRSSDSTHLTIGAVSAGDAGLLILPLRSASFADDLYVTVVQRHSAWSVFPYINVSNTVVDSLDVIVGTTYEDTDEAYGGFNLYPPGVVSIQCATATQTCYNHIWVFVDSGVDYATITFTATADDWVDVGTESFTWTAPGSWTVTGGAVNSDTFTAQVPSSATNYVLTCTIVNDYGFATTRTVIVWVKARSGTNAPLVVTSLTRVEWTTAGAQLQFALNDNLLASLPDGSMLVIAQERLYSGQPIASAITQFIGWVITIDQTSAPGLRSAQPNFVTVDGLLALKYGTSQLWATAASPSTWQQVPTALCTISFAMYWLLAQRARGVLELFDFIPASLDKSGQWMPRIDVQAASLWEQLTSLANGFQKRVIGADPDGSLWVMQSPSLIASYPRSSIVVRDTWDASIYHDLDWPRTLFPKTGWVQGSAFTWDGISTQPTPLLALAPGLQPGQGGVIDKCENQIVDSQDTLNALTGNYLASVNADYPDITANLQGMRASLIKPAQYPFVHLQIPDYLSPTGIALDRYAVPVSIEETYNSDGTVDSAVHLALETYGLPAATQPIPPPNSALYTPTTPVAFSPPAVVTNSLFPPYNGVLPISLFVVSAADALAKLGVSFDPVSGAITYADRSTDISGTYFTDLSFNPFNYFMARGATDAGLEQLDDVSAGGSWHVLQAMSALFGSGKLITGIAHTIRRNGAIFLWSGENAFCYSLNGGASFSSPVSVNGLTLAAGTDVTARANCSVAVVEADTRPGRLWVLALDNDGSGNYYAIFHATNFGATWTRVARIPGGVGGLGLSISIPYLRADGVTLNIDDASLEIKVETGGDSHYSPHDTVYWTADQGGTWGGLEMSLWSASSGSPRFSHTLAPFTYNGSIWYVRDGKTVKRSLDNFATLSAALLTTTAWPIINGWPPNPNALIVTDADGGLACSFDGGTTWPVSGAPSDFTSGKCIGQYCLYPFQPQRA